SPGKALVVSSEPAWVGDALRRSWEKFRLFFATAWSMTRTPRRFGHDWAEGRHVAINPLGFFGASLGAFGPLLYVIRRFLDVDGVAPIGWLRQVEPSLQWIVLGLLCHAMLRPLGATRGLSLTVGISLFAGGG